MEVESWIWLKKGWKFEVGNVPFLVGCFRNGVRNASFLRDGISCSGFNILEKKGTHKNKEALCVSFWGPKF